MFRITKRMFEVHRQYFCCLDGGIHEVHKVFVSGMQRKRERSGVRNPSLLTPNTLNQYSPKAVYWFDLGREVKVSIGNLDKLSKCRNYIIASRDNIVTGVFVIQNYQDDEFSVVQCDKAEIRFKGKPYIGSQLNTVQTYIKNGLKTSYTKVIMTFRRTETDD